MPTNGRIAHKGSFFPKSSLSFSIFAADWLVATVVSLPECEEEPPNDNPAQEPSMNKPRINYPAASSGVLKAKANNFLRGKPRGIYPQRLKIKNKKRD